MDVSHVALVSLDLAADGFDEFRSDKSMVLGVDVDNLAKIMRLANPTDTITLSASGPHPTSLNLLFEGKENNCTTEFSMKLLSLDDEGLELPESEYSSVVSIHSAEFQKTCRELAALDSSVTISSQQEQVQFYFQNESAAGSVTLGLND